MTASLIIAMEADSSNDPTSTIDTAKADIPEECSITPLECIVVDRTSVVDVYIAPAVVLRRGFISQYLNNGSFFF